MPWKHKTANTVRQVRDNQRRSRARRKELLEDMQQRLNEYERLGVEATREMQQAARDVAKENEQLRVLLARKGVSDAEVEEFLRTGDSAEDQPAQDRRTSRAHASSKEPVLRQIRSQSTPRVSSVTALLNEEQPTTSACSFHRKPLSAALSSNEERLFVMSDKNDTATSSANFLGFSETMRPTQSMGHNSGMETSCDVAATILANVQGHGDTSRARVALGCTESSACVVKNLRVFDLLDEAG